MNSFTLPITRMLKMNKANRNDWLFKVLHLCREQAAHIKIPPS